MSQELKVTDRRPNYDDTSTTPTSTTVEPVKPKRIPRAFNDVVIMTLFEESIDKYEGSNLYKSEKFQNSREGVIVAWGPKVQSELKVGDHVFFGLTVESINLDGEDFILCREGDLRTGW